MQELQIPDKFKPGFELLVRIESKTVEKLMAALSQALPFLRIEDLASAVASRVQVLTEEEVGEIMEAVISLYNLRDYSGASIDELTEGISQAFEEDEQLPHISEEEKQEFERRLASFLNLDGVLSVTSKAINVVRDHERIFTGSRILTDMRPIFGSDLEKAPAGVAIVHMLKIEYGDLQGEHEFFVALNAIDLEQLRQQLDKANKKAKSIGMMLNKVNISHLNYPDVE